MKLTSPSEYRRLLTAAQNGIGRALEFLDPKAFAPVLENIKLAESLVELAVNKRPPRESVPLMVKLQGAKREPLKELLLLISHALRDLITLKESDSAPLKFYCDRNYAIDLCDRTTLAYLFDINQAVDLAIEENSRNANVRLLVTKLFSSVDLI